MRALCVCARHLRDPRGTLEALLRSKVTQLPGHIQSIYVQNILKLYSRVLSQAESENDTETVTEIGALLLEKLPMFVQSADLEVQERVGFLPYTGNTNTHLTAATKPD